MNQSTARDSFDDDVDDTLHDSYIDSDVDLDIPYTEPTTYNHPQVQPTTFPRNAPSNPAASVLQYFEPGNVTTYDRADMSRQDGRVMINHYVLESMVGRGQHGAVWKCHDHLDPNRILAMKIVKRDNPKAKRERQYKRLRQQGGIPRTEHVPVVDGIRTVEQDIRKEIAIMKKCLHPHVVSLYEVIDDRKNECIHMVMEYLGGGEIKYTNGNQKPILKVEQTRRILRDAILGLEYLHHQGIIHRDIKPGNLIWTTNHDRVKIADFGTAHFSYAQRLSASDKRNEDEDPILLDETALAKKAGSPAFIAPETVWEYTNGWQIGDSRPPITKAIDIWALGVTLYCLLFGKTPFRPPREYYSLTEWSGYHWVCNHDWRAPSKMGFDEIPTGGRHPDPEEDEDGTVQEGPVVIHLLDHLLTKDYDLRITLEEVKMNRWFLHDLPNPDTWLQVTSPKPIVVTNEETSDALSVLKFRWNPFRRVGIFIRNTVAPRGRGARASLLPPADTHAHHAMSSNLSQKRKESERRKSVRRTEDSTGTMSEPDMRLKSYRHSGSEEVNRKQKKSRNDDRGKQKAQDDAERLDVVYKNRRPMSTMNLGLGSSGQGSSRRSSQGLDSEQRSKSSDDGLRKAAQRSRQTQRLASPGLSQVVHEVHNATSLPSASQALRTVIARSTVTPIAAPAAAATSKAQSRRGSDAHSNYQQREWCSCMRNAMDSDSDSEPSSPRASSVNSGYGELQSPPSSSSMLAPRSPSQSLSPTGSHSRSHSKTPSFSSFPTLNLSSHSITRFVRPGKAKTWSRPGTPTSPVTLTPTPAKLWTGTTPTGSIGSNASSSPSTTRKGLSGILSGLWKQSRSQSHQEQPSLVRKYKEKEKSGSFTAPTTSVPSPQSDYPESPIDGLQEDLIKSVQRKAVLGASPGSTSGPGSGSGSAGQSRDNLFDVETSSAASASNTALDSSKTLKSRSTGKRSSRYLSPNVPVQRSSTKPFGYQSMAFKTGAAGGDADMMDVGSLERRTSSWDHDNREFEDFTSIHSDDYGLAVRDVDDHVVYVGAGGVGNRQDLEDAERMGQQRWTEELHRKRAEQQVMDEASDDEYDGNEDGDNTEPVQRHCYDAHFRHSQAYAEDEDEDSEALTFSAKKKRIMS